MMSRAALRRAVINGGLSMPGLLEVVANVVGVWPLIFSNLSENSKNVNGDIILVQYKTLF